MSQLKRAWWMGLMAIACSLCWMLPGLAVDEALPDTPRVPIVLDGRELFVIGNLDDFAASERADFVTRVLQDQRRRIPPNVPIRVTQLQRGELITLRLSGRHLLTITEQDLIGNLPVQEQADLWADKLQSALEQARQQRTRQYRQRTLVKSLLAAFGIGGLYFLLRWFRRWLRRRRGQFSREQRSWSEVALFGLQWAIVFGFGLWLTEIWPEVRSLRYPALSFLQTTFTADTLSLGERGYSILEISKVILLALALWFVVRALTRGIRSRFLQTIGADPTVQDAIALSIQIILTTLGLLVLLQAVGIDISSLAIFASVIGVGIGFGLQNIANNFISGLIIMLERPVQVGDFVKLGDLTGTVERIGIRSTEISTLDRVTIIVPNSEFIDSKVINWSHGYPVSRLHIPLGVAYGSPIKQVRQAVFEAAKHHPKVLRYPKPQLWFEGFGDSSLDFNLLVWIREPRQQFRIKSDLYYLLEANLRRFHIEIPFPQRDLNLRTPGLEEFAQRLQTPEDRADLPLPALKHPAKQSTLTPPETLAAAIADCGILDHTDAPADIEIQELVAQMRGRNGLDIRDRRFGLHVYTRCFVGSEAVQWLMQQQLASREEAIKLGQVLVERGIIHHVTDEHTFKDSHLFYRFFEDEMEL
ncbi:MAG: mechanosensitive ion channel [Leptolyngbya sp. SIOISBB]|nr:mechanosensitive ion channel [Leptolyngbya sp. SIOISBB]